MSIPELLDQLKVAGVLVVMTPDGPRLRGKQASPELLAEVKQHKAALVKVLKEEAWEARDRYGKAPEETIRLHLDWPRPAKLDRPAALFDYVLNQNSAVQSWAVKRADAYWAAGVSDFLEAEYRGALDLLCWQRQAPPAEALAWLEGLTESARTIHHGDTENIKKNLP